MSETRPAANGGIAPPETREDRMLAGIRRLVFGIFLLFLIAALYFASGFLLPLALAVLFFLVLSPIVRWGRRRGVPPGLSALVLVVAVSVTIFFGAYLLSGPASTWINEAPMIAQRLQGKVSSLLERFRAFQDVSASVDQIAGGGAENPEVQRVVVSEPGLLTRAASGLPDFITKSALTIVLLFFLLATGDLFTEKLIKVLPTLSDKKTALRIAREIESDLSRYLFTITAINVGFGAAVAGAMAIIGLPSPLLWGAAAGIFNFVPYLGAALGILTVTVVGLVTFDSVGYALVAPASYFAISFLEGQFLTPALVGRRLELNVVAVFIAIAFWGWLWGIIGTFIAVPLLVIMKVFADNIDGFAPIGEFLAAREPPPPPEPAVNGAETQPVVRTGAAP